MGPTAAGQSLAPRLGRVWPLSPPPPRSPAIISSLRKARASACWSVCKARERGHRGCQHRAWEPLAQCHPRGAGRAPAQLEDTAVSGQATAPSNLRSSGATRVPARAVGCRQPPAPGSTASQGGSVAQGPRSPCAALASQARSAIFGISSIPLIGISGAAATGTCRPRSSFSWRRGPAA